MLEHEADTPVTYVDMGHVAFAEQNAAVGVVVRCLEPGDDPQQGGLAGTGRAQQADQLAAVDVQVDGRQRLGASEVLLDMVETNAHVRASRRVARHSSVALAARVSRAISASRAALAKAPTVL